MTTMGGTVSNISQVQLGDELASDAAAGSTALVVSDAADFSEEGGTLRVGGVGGEVIAYSAVDDTSGTITLATPTGAAHSAGDRVDLWDTALAAPSVEWRALVQPLGDLETSDAVDAVVAYPLVPMLPEGIRDPNAGESVVLERQGGEWVVTDVRGRAPQFDGSVITPSTIVKGALSFTVGSTTATLGTAPANPATNDLWFDAANGYRMMQWNGTAWVPAQFGAGALSVQARDLGANTTTIAAAAPAPAIAGDLWIDTSNGYRLNRFDGASWSAVQFGTNALAAGAVTAAVIAAHTITAGQIAAGSITANEIAAGSITGDRIAANAITTGLIAAGAVAASQIATGALDASTITAGSIIAGAFSGTIGGDSTNPTSINSADIDGCTFYADNDGGRVLTYTAATPTTTTLTATGSWTPPAGVTSVKVETWAGGGSGAAGGGGGGGGEYARNNAVPVTPGTAYNFTIGAGGAAVSGAGGPAAGNAGGNTTFTGDSGTVVTAHGGKGGLVAGQAAGGTGSTAPYHYNGGAGANYGLSGGNQYGGGGGSGAGSGKVGTSATSQSGAAAPAGGGNGGSGGAASSSAANAGAAGAAPGGAGGGGSMLGLGTAGGGGAGARGQIVLTYTSSTPVLEVSLAAASGTDPYGNAYPAGLGVNGAQLDGAWVNWTPVLKRADTLAVIASTPNGSRYKIVGKTIIVHGDITANAGTTNGAYVTLPFVARDRIFSFGTCGVWGATTPADQSGHAFMAADKAGLIVAAFTGGYRDVVSGAVIRFTCIYELP